MIRTKKWDSPSHMSFYSTRNPSKISLRRSSDPFCFVNINFYDHFNIQEYILFYFIWFSSFNNISSIIGMTILTIGFFLSFFLFVFFLLACCSCLNMLFISQQKQCSRLNLSGAMNAQKHFHPKASWSNTCSFTVRKSHSAVTFAKGLLM